MANNPGDTTGKANQPDKSTSVIKAPAAKPGLANRPAHSAANGHSDLRQQLLRRIGMAALLIFTLLGGLALFDSFNSSPEFEDEDTRDSQNGRTVEPPKPIKPAPTVEAQAPATLPPASSEPKVPETTTPSAAPTTALSAAPKTASTPSVSVAPAAPAALMSPAATPAALASTAATADKPAAPASGKSIPLRPAPAASSAVIEPAVPGRLPVPPPPEIAARPALPTAESGVGTRAADLAKVDSPSIPPRTGYVLQSVSLPDAARAAELQAKLVQLGIPSIIETRLQIGPFRNRAEAENARRKLSELGIDGSLQRLKPAAR